MMFRFLFLIVVCSACRGKEETELQKICRQIRSEPQTEFPSAHDKKWQLIEGVSKIQDENWPDSLKSIFSSIDTSVKGYSKYHYAILTQLVVPDSRRALKSAAEIFKTHYISDPSCSQVLTNLFTDQRLWEEMMASHLSKQNPVDYSKVLKNLDVMFPDLAEVLGKHPFSDGSILSLLNMGIGSAVLDKKNLETSKPHLVNYYHLLNRIRSGQVAPFYAGFRYDGYAENHMPNLISVLKIFQPDQEIDSILAEVQRLPADSVGL